MRKMLWIFATRGTSEREEVEAEHCGNNASASDVILLYAVSRVRVYTGCTNTKRVDNNLMCCHFAE